MESSKEATLTLFTHSGDKLFPTDPKGQVSITFETKNYKCKSQVLDYSAVLAEIANQTNNNITLSKVLTHAKSEEVCDQIMKLLIGITDVTVPTRLFVQFYYFLEEL